MWRRQPPVHSPLDAVSIARGLGAMLGRRDAAHVAARELLAERYGARRVVLTDSGTSALLLALRAAVAVGGERVAVPAYSCYDVATAWVGAGVRPRLYDLDPSTLGPDPPSLTRAAGENVGAVVVAYLYGMALDWDGIRRAVDGSGALLIEDAAQAAGCRWEGRPAGALGDLSVLSFGRGKGWTAGGGGALLALTDRGERALSAIEAEVRLAPAASGPCLLRAAAQWLFGRPALYGLPAAVPWLGLGETVYRPPTPPRAASSFSLGALVATHRLQEDELTARRANAARLRPVVEEAPGLRAVTGPAAGVSGDLRLPILAEDGTLGRLGSPRAARLGVMHGYPRPLHELPEVAEGLDPGAAMGGLDGSEHLARALYTVPTHGLLAPRELRALEALLRAGAGKGAGRRADGRAVPTGDGSGAEPGAGHGGSAVPFAALSVLSFVSYLVFSQAVRAFGENAVMVLRRMLELLS